MIPRLAEELKGSLRSLRPEEGAVLGLLQQRLAAQKTQAKRAQNSNSGSEARGAA